MKRKSTSLTSPLSDLSPLFSLTNLTYLNIRDNQLDLSEGAKALEDIGQLKRRGVRVPISRSRDPGSGVDVNR